MGRAGYYAMRSRFVWLYDWYEKFYLNEVNNGQRNYSDL